MEMERIEADNVTAQIQNYIQTQKISVSQMSSDLGISGERLIPGGNRTPFSASEFLELCVYLGICPEKFRKRDIDC